MSWFDPSGIASLAKNALKEAQKTIDKALDIKDDDQSQPGSTLLDLTTSTSTAPALSDSKDGSTKVSPSDTYKMKQSISNPALPVSIWGSFTGSFFDNPNADEGKTVTTPPSASSSIASVAPVRQREKSGSKDSQGLLSESSESVEIVSSPTSPGSGIASPDAISNMHCSDSIEVITNLTPSSELITVSSSASELDLNPYADSVEIISDEAIEDDVSFEDDSKSYNTVTETTATAPTIVEPKVAITTAPSRSSLHLPLDMSVNATEHRSPFLLKRSTSTSVASKAETTLDDGDGAIPKLLQDASLEKSVEIFEEQTQLSDSTQSFEYVNQAVLQDGINRDGSPNSSEERSDIVKINSEPTSGHTSADEVETATSSDIEIISSPNGDSSSTNSAYKVSPSMCQMSNACISASVTGTLKKKGHFRESSTHSIQSTASDDSRFSVQSETERLMRRISELSEVLESREYKLMELGRENAELHERNAEMKIQLDTKRKRDDCLEVTTVTEEYTQRLSALEKKFQQSIRERDNLRDQLKAARTELSGKVSKEDIELVIRDKDFIIQELKTEGEKLSKQILQHSNIIKKLRAKEKENDATLKRQKDQLDEFTEETDRLKKSLSAKDEVERSQIEAVHKLSSEKRKLEKETAQLRSQLDDTVQKLKTVQTSLEAAKKEIYDKQHAHTELSRKTEAVASLESENRIAQTQNQQFMLELTNLREQLRQVEGGTSQKEQSLRQENAQLLRRLEDAEQKLEEQAQSVTDATIPLVRQLEAIQSSLNLRTLAWEKQEKSLLEKLEQTQSQQKRLVNIEQQSKDQDQASNSKILKLEEQLSAALLKTEQTSSLLQQRVVEFELSENDFKTKLSSLKATVAQQVKTIEDAQMEMAELRRQLEAAENMAEQKRRQLQEYNVSTGTAAGGGGALLEQQQASDAVVPDERRLSRDNSSPTLSLGRMSMADSLSSNLWPLDDMDCISNSGRPSGGGNLGSHTTSLLENLQANLKQRDGENHQLQWELSRLQSDRNILMEEVSKLTMQLDTIKEKLQLNESIEEQFTDLQRKYDALLQMYGEKVEEIQELNLDLDDVKEMYRGQIDELLRQQKQQQQLQLQS